jgi:hypothetical protein
LYARAAVFEGRGLQCFCAGNSNEGQGLNLASNFDGNSPSRLVDGLSGANNWGKPGFGREKNIGMYDGHIMKDIRNKTKTKLRMYYQKRK